MGWLDDENEKKRINGLPSWMLTPSEEKKVLEEYQKEVWRKCDKYVQEFKKCEANAGFGGFAVLFECKEQGNAMRACVDHHHQHQYVDEVRDAFIQKKLAELKDNDNKKA
jgi:COX assembly protein 1